MNKKVFCQDWRYAQANREALLSLGMYALYFIWWYACAYGLGSGDPAEYTYVFGLPSWFFYSCILGYPLLSFALWLMVRFCFKEIPLDEEGCDEDDATGPPSTTAPHADDTVGGEHHPEVI